MSVVGAKHLILSAEAHLVSRLLWVVIWYRRNHKAREYLSRIKMTNGVACAAPNKMIIGSVKRQRGDSLVIAGL